jgi:hypothetical protein
VPPTHADDNVARNIKGTQNEVMFGTNTHNAVGTITKLLANLILELALCLYDEAITYMQIDELLQYECVGML